MRKYIIQDMSNNNCEVEIFPKRCFEDIYFSECAFETIYNNVIICLDRSYGVRGYMFYGRILSNFRNADYDLISKFISSFDPYDEDVVEAFGYKLCDVINGQGKISFDF